MVVMVKFGHCFGHSLLNFDGKIWTAMTANIVALLKVI